MDELQRLIGQLRQHRYRMTPQRRAVLAAMLGPISHPSADQIYEMVCKQMPDISLATIYNTLRELVAIQEARELDLGLRGRRYDIERREHAHLVCTHCGKIEDVMGDLAQVKASLPHGNGFRPMRYDAAIYGCCADCEPSQVT
ncbi:MAG: transcriptional repressor [Ardenticatenia bacterium]|nr:transcriptional repressor [Ardenticatenia bacterium]